MDSKKKKEVTPTQNLEDGLGHVHGMDGILRVGKLRVEWIFGGQTQQGMQRQHTRLVCTRTCVWGFVSGTLEVCIRVHPSVWHEE